MEQVCFRHYSDLLAKGEFAEGNGPSRTQGSRRGIPLPLLRQGQDSSHVWRLGSLVPSQVRSFPNTRSLQPLEIGSKLVPVEASEVPATSFTDTLTQNLYVVIEKFNKSK